MNQHQRVAELLRQIESALRALDQWAATHPEPELLQSQEPFCVDTLSFPEWLQFVMLPRMWALVEGQHPLPRVSGIEPMAALYFSGRDTEDLLAALQRLDEELSDSGLSR